MAPAPLAIAKSCTPSMRLLPLAPAWAPIPPFAMPSHLLLVDAHHYAFRSFHAIRSLNAPDGSPTNAIFGFIKTLQKMVGLVGPSHVCVVWDAGLDVERTRELPQYKANRSETPESLSLQIPQIIEWLDAAGWPQWQRAGTEADDWIATLASRACREGCAVTIASADKDFMQLVGGEVRLLNPNDKTERLWGPAEVEAKTGVPPSQVADWLALVGDAVDNIPGVPGVGPKTAADLLRKFGSAEGAIAAAPGIKAERLRAELLGAAETLRRNLVMVRLKADLPDGPSLGSLVPRPADPARLRPMYQRWNFRSLLAELGPEGGPVQGTLL